MSGAALFFGGQLWSAEKLQGRAQRLAGGFAEFGLREGDVVAALQRNGTPYAELILACRIAGVGYCPLNWHLRPEEVRYILADSGARLLIGDGDILDAVSEAIPQAFPVIRIGSADQPAASPYEEWIAKQKPYDGPLVPPRGHMGYTSGTTGRPKGVVRKAFPADMITVAANGVARIMDTAFGIRPDTRILIPAPIYHSAVSLVMQHALTTAEFIVLADRFEAESLLRQTETHRINTLYLVPIMFVRLLALPAEVRQRYDISSLRFVGSTGAPCAPEVKSAMIDWFGPIIHESYASTECGIVTTIDSPEALERPGSVGRALHDARIAIYSDEGRPCVPGEPGLVYCRQPAWPDFTYRGNDEARQAIERDGLITLGDIGYVDDAGFLFVCDRASDMVISGGVNIYPVEIEKQMIRYPGVADCAVFGIPDDEFGERLHAVVEPVPGAELRSADIIEWLRGPLSGYKIPRSFEFRDLLRDENGKIAKKRLRGEYWGGRSRRV